MRKIVSLFISIPPANIYIPLGNLTGDTECWYFWDRAGLRSEDIMRVIPAVRSRLRRDRLPDVELVPAGSHQIARKPRGKDRLIAIPLLPVVAAALGGKGDPEIALEQASPEALLAAPNHWCPNPVYTSCLRVRGRSMMPLLHDTYIIVVDTSQTDHGKVYGHIVVAAHSEQGLIVSRLQRYDETEVLVPENREYDSISISTTSWRVVAKVLWSIGRPNGK